MRIRPPRRQVACPDCDGKVTLIHGKTWRCRNALCSSSGVMLAGESVVRERARIIHKPLFLTGNERRRRGVLVR